MLFRSGHAADVAHKTAALQALNRYASNREAADASDAAASALSAHAVASASDPVAAEAERSQAEKDFHRGLALSMLEGRPVTIDGRPATRDGGPLRAAAVEALASGEPEVPEQTFGEWSRENRWQLPVVWGGGGGDPNFQPFVHEHNDADYPDFFQWGCWYCDCGPGCCGGGGRSTQARRNWSPGNLD